MQFVFVLSVSPVYSECTTDSLPIYVYETCMFRLSPGYNKHIYIYMIDY